MAGFENFGATGFENFGATGFESYDAPSFLCNQFPDVADVVDTTSHYSFDVVDPSSFLLLLPSELYFLNFCFNFFLFFLIPKLPFLYY